jgi:putative protease
MQQPELLAPGGTPSKAKLALAYGADAVYCGMNIFALRQHPGNFTYETLGETVDYAHRLGKKVYVVMNVFAHNSHLKVIERAIVKLRAIKPDAFIISDAGVFSLVKELSPEIPIHISTQASVTNALGVRFWAQLGAARIILARELNLPEIREIHQQFPDIEIETFIHGAQCMAYSGRCMLSAHMTDARKANLGSCVNSCRWKYKEVVESQRPGEVITVEEDEFGTYIFNANDMCMIEHLAPLVEAGIVSFKIEGRGRSEFYVARAIKSYREALDQVADTSAAAKQRLAELQVLLLKSSPRDFDTGFFFGPPRQSVDKRTSAPTHKFVGEFVAQIDERTARVLVKNEIYAGETVHVMTPTDDYELELDILIKADTQEQLAAAYGGKKDEIIVMLPKPVSPHLVMWLDETQRPTPVKGSRVAVAECRRRGSRARVAGRLRDVALPLECGWTPPTSGKD